MKGALTMVNAREPEAGKKPAEDERYYIPCPLRKNQARVPATYCAKRCEFARISGSRISCAVPLGKK